MNVFHKKQIGRFTAKQRLSVVCRVCIHVVLNWIQDKAKKQSSNSLDLNREEEMRLHIYLPYNLDILISNHAYDLIDRITVTI